MSPEEVLAEAVIHCAFKPASDKGIADSLLQIQALLRVAERSWTHASALTDGHVFDRRVNASETQQNLLDLATKPPTALRSELRPLALTQARRTCHTLRTGTISLGVPLRGWHPGGMALAAVTGIVETVAGLPVALTAAALVDWSGEGLHRGIAQSYSGLANDARTCFHEVQGYSGTCGWLALFEELLGLPVMPDGVAGVEERESRIVTYAFERLGSGLEQSPPELFHFEASSLLQIPRFEPRHFATLFPLDAAAKLCISGGGLRDHCYDVIDLQRARSVFHLVCVVARLRTLLKSCEA